MKTLPRSGASERRAVAGTGKNRWTVEQRLTLHIMFGDLQMDEKLVTRVFNEIFRDRLRTHGYPQGMKVRVLRAQYSKKERAKQCWTNILREPTSPADRETREELAMRIRAAAASLGLGIAEQPASPRPERLSKASLTVESDDSDEEYELQPPAKRMKTVRRSGTSAPFGPETTTLLHSPSSPPSQLVDYIRLDGSSIRISPEKRRRAETHNYVPVTEKAAYPMPQPPALCFRYWSQESQGKNAPDGFIAGRFKFNNVRPRPPPLSTELDPSDLENHINRNQVASPFISVSISLCWIIRLAMKDDKENGYITLIDCAKIDRRGFYHLPPFHTELAKQLVFTRGAFRYRGTREYLVWHSIPTTAIIQTVAVSDLKDLANRIPALADMLRLNMLTARADYTKTLLQAFRTQALELLLPTINAIAMLVAFLGVAIDSVPQLAYIVSEIISGWSLKVNFREYHEWNQAAAVFAHHLGICSRPGRVLTLLEQKSIEFAFLTGVRSSHGDLNWSHDAKKTRVMMKRSGLSGCKSPANIIISELEGVLATMKVYRPADEEPLVLHTIQSAGLHTIQPTGSNSERIESDEMISYDREEEGSDQERAVAPSCASKSKSKGKGRMEV